MATTILEMCMSDLFENFPLCLEDLVSAIALVCVVGTLMVLPAL